MKKVNVVMDKRNYVGKLVDKLKEKLKVFRSSR